jgi:hypothetical protein
MIEVAPRVYVGNQEDAEYGWKKNDEWAFIHCAKEPYHRQFVGYLGRGCPKDNPEYLYAIRGNAIALNIIDVDDPNFFDMDSIKMAIGFALKHDDRRLLFHCNQGESRSPSIAMLYLAIIDRIPKEDFWSAEKAFKKIYLPYNPKNGIRTHIRSHWLDYTIL